MSEKRQHKFIFGLGQGQPNPASRTKKEWFPPRAGPIQGTGIIGLPTQGEG